MARKVVVPAYDPSSDGVEALEIQFRDKTMMSTEVIPASALLKLGRIFANINDLSDESGDRMFEIFQGLYDMVLSLIVPEDRHVFEEVIEDSVPPVSIQELQSAVEVIVGELMGNPSEPSSDSASTTKPTPEESTALLSLPDIATVLPTSAQ